MAKPTTFSEANMMWRGWPQSKTRDEVGDLPAFIDRTNETQPMTISCWKMTLRERLYILFKGVVWLRVWGQQPPVYVEGEYPFERTNRVKARGEDAKDQTP